jgi:hypothetical protein
MTAGVAIVALDGSGHSVGVSAAAVAIGPQPFVTLANQIITQEKKGWFYHRALLHDVNGDGTMDIVTSRATAPGKDQQVRPAIARHHAR